MHTSNSINIAILGAGSWGIALANHCLSMGHLVRLWEFDPNVALQLQEQRVRPKVLKNVKISSGINITADLEQAVQDTTLILLVVPSHVVRNVLQQLAKFDLSNAILINCAKGLETDSLNRISQIVEQELTKSVFSRYTVLSGPSHAEEVSQNIPTAVVAASSGEIVARFVQQNLSSKTFRVYRSKDVAGVELGGALKNVIAIAAGVCDGAGFGDNTKAALQPRGLAEMSRLGVKLGADPLTFSGLSGMGDLIVTCMSRHSRNRFVGEQIGSGKTLDHVLSEMTMVAEGVRTSKATVKLAAEHNVEMPICLEVFSLLYEQKNPKQALEDLMTREVKPEIWY